MPPGQDTAAIIIDYKSTTLRTNPSLGVARKVLAILQDHYVETLGRGLIVNLPWMLAFFYKGLSPFMDPVTRDKVRVCALFLSKSLLMMTDSLQPGPPRARPC